MRLLLLTLIVLLYSGGSGGTGLNWPNGRWNENGKNLHTNNKRKYNSHSSTHKKYGRYGHSKPSYVSPPPYGWSSNGKPANPKLYQARPPLYQFPYPPAYSKPYYSGPISMQSYAPRPPAYRIHSVPVMQPVKHSNFVQNAVFYGLGRGNSHYCGSDYETTTTSTNRQRTTIESSISTVDLNEEELYARKQTSFSKVKKDPIDYQPILLEDSIQNLPFYGYQYPTWNESEIVNSKSKIVAREEKLGLGNGLANAFFRFTNWWIGKPVIEPKWDDWIDQHTTTTTEKPHGWKRNDENTDYSQHSCCIPF